MIIKGINNQSIEFRILNYQFPGNEDCEYDSNWLNIFIKVDSTRGNWQAIEPALLTWEIQQLIEWLKRILANKKIHENPITFIEPCLVIELLKKNDKKNLRFHFNYEFKPQNANDEIEYFVDASFSNQEFKDLITNLENELSKFPERTVHKKRQ